MKYFLALYEIIETFSFLQKSVPDMKEEIRKNLEFFEKELKTLQVLYSRTSNTFILVTPFLKIGKKVTI